MSERRADDSPTTVVIFGASGDLTRRKLIPALYELCRKGRLPEGLNVVGFARRDWTHDGFREHLEKSLKEFAADRFDPEHWATFSKRLWYCTGDVSRVEDYQKLSRLLESLETARADRVYYLALAPELYPKAIELLGSAGMASECECWRRIVIEKPFGRDLESARDLNRIAHEAFSEKQIYRIDHYLGKETAQNILFFRFANGIFEPVWNRNYIDHVQITVAEEVDVGHRADYYDKVGVLRDMFQNHLLQLLALTAMEPPSSFEADAIRNEKVKVFSAIRPPRPERVAVDTVRAQYRSYRDAPGVAPESDTPTYAALRLHVDNWRWQGVPFFLRSGKALARKASQIVIQFRYPPHVMFPLPPGDKIRPNLIVLSIQPDEGIDLRFEIKVPDTLSETRSVNMAFDYTDEFGPRSIPDAYERLLLDVMNGDASLFTRSDAIELAWKFVDGVVEAWEATGEPPLSFYEPGSWGPPEADAFMQRFGRAWQLASQHWEG